MWNVIILSISSICHKKCCCDLYCISTSNKANLYWRHLCFNWRIWSCQLFLSCLELLAAHANSSIHYIFKWENLAETSASKIENRPDEALYTLYNRITAQAISTILLESSFALPIAFKTVYTNTRMLAAKPLEQIIHECNLNETYFIWWCLVY